jgi:hypothetical protein
MHQNGSDGYFFSLFLWLLELKVKKGSLAHVKTWFRRRFCCLVIYANLHNLPCICIKMAPTGTFFLLSCLSLHRNLQESSQRLKASQAQWQEGAGQPASVVASCFIAPLHAMGNNETSATIRHKWNGSKNIGVSLRRASTWVCSGLVWNRHSLLRRLWNKAAEPLPQYDCLRHPLTRSSPKKQRSRGWVTSQTKTCCPWKLPWRHRRVHMHFR